MLLYVTITIIKQNQTKIKSSALNQSEVVLLSIFLSLP